MLVSPDNDGEERASTYEKYADSWKGILEMTERYLRFVWLPMISPPRCSAIRLLAVFCSATG